VIREYVWLDSSANSQGASLPIAVFTPDPAVSGSNGLSAAGVPTAAAINSTPLVFYIHADHLNTARVITSHRLNTAAAGAPQNNIRWSWLPNNTATTPNPTTVNTSAGDPFGATPANANPSNLAAGNFTFNLRFAGQYFDKESGLHYNHHRDYDPTLGRYVQSDPIGLAGGLNTYLYVGADPNGGVDPEGRNAFAFGRRAFGGGYRVGTIINNRFGMQIADAIDVCMSSRPSREEQCQEDWHEESNACEKYWSLGPAAYRACKARATDRLRLCIRGQGRRPPVWSPGEMPE
jgi:RHS repeat-associated protein